MVATRCPRCHRSTHELRAAPRPLSIHELPWQCRCGRAPGPDVEQVRAALQDRQASAWLELAVVLVLDAAAVGGFVYAALQGFIVFSALGCTTLILLTAREVQRVRMARAWLRQIAPRPAVLPRAVVHRR